jgi:hypothetical protein
MLADVGRGNLVIIKLLAKKFVPFLQSTYSKMFCSMVLGGGELGAAGCGLGLPAICCTGDYIQDLSLYRPVPIFRPPFASSELSNFDTFYLTN